MRLKYEEERTEFKSKHASYSIVAKREMARPALCAVKWRAPQLAPRTEPTVQTSHHLCDSASRHHLAPRHRQVKWRVVLRAARYAAAAAAAVATTKAAYKCQQICITTMATAAAKHIDTPPLKWSPQCDLAPSNECQKDKR